MADATLTFDKIRQRIGLKRGYGSTIADWDDDQKELVEQFVADGLDMFYNQSSYEWSFMAPIVTLKIPDGTTEIALPASFGFLAGDIYFESSVAAAVPLEVRNAGEVLLARQRDSSTTGRPQCAAIDERAPSELHGQRKYLIFWPEADDDYTVTLRYTVLSDALSSSNPFPWGGAAHTQTILQACLAKSEQFDGTIGIQTQLYMLSLAASKDYDRRVKAQTLGYNGDGRKTTYNIVQPYVTYTSNL